MPRTLNGCIRSKNTTLRVSVEILKRSLQYIVTKEEKPYQACLNGNESNLNSWLPRILSYRHKACSGGVRLLRASQELPHSLSGWLQPIKKVCVLLWSSIYSSALTLSFLERQKIFSRKTPNPLYFIMATATATEICEWSTWMQTVMDISPVLWRANEPVQIR